VAFKIGRRPFLIATLRASRLLASCFVAHRSKTTGVFSLFASRIQLNSQRRH
jgi:hypothetical protein